MLADSCESCCSFIRKDNPKKNRAMVNEIVKSKINDQQLSEADITIKEINIVKHINRWACIPNHSRISYQKLKIKR